MGIKIYVENGKLIHIGRMGENLATTVIFDVKPLIEAVDSNSPEFSLLVFQEELIELQDLSYNGSLQQLSWNITQSFTLKKGKGKCQIVCHANEKVSKSEIYDIIVTDGVISNN